MADSSFLSRFALSRDPPPILPLHTKALRPKPGEYDLEELSPRPSRAALSVSASDTDPHDFFGEASSSQARPSTVSFAYQDAYRSRPSPSRAGSQPHHEYDHNDNGVRPSPRTSRTREPVLFAGPPPPIATSMLMYRDVEDRNGPVLEAGRRRRGGSSSSMGESTVAGSIRLPTSTVLLRPRQLPLSSGPRGSKGASSLDGDSTWVLLQRRERALQNEIQAYLDIQSAGLSAGLGRGPGSASRSPGRSSDSGLGGGSRSSRSNTPTTAESVAGRARHLPTERATATGAVIPVRQPKPRKVGLRRARSGLARSISMLADLKAEEDASLATALLARKRALAHLRRLARRRDEIAGELQTLETDDAEPLARELSTLRSAHASTSQQITELEGQLAMLRQRKRTLASRIEDTVSQREAGLSGYRGALREVREQLTAVLRRPPIQPLDAGAWGDRGASRGEQQEDAIRLEDRDSVEDDADADVSAGVEFLRLLPERRTAEMASFWWESEMRLLERRRAEVSTERAALEEGGLVWQEAVQLVSGFEANLRRAMVAGADGARGEEEEEEEEREEEGDHAKGKGREPTPEERMRTQLGTMAAVIHGLRAHLRTAEDKGWNLLLCAIGAELEAFQEARTMLRQALRDAGMDVEDAEDEDGSGGESSDRHLIDPLDPGTDNATRAAIPPGFGKEEPEDRSATPRVSRSQLAATDAAAADQGRGRDRDDHAASESDDNEVPPDLLVTHEHEENRSTAGRHGHHNDKDDSSENEVPPEFLAEQE